MDPEEIEAMNSWPRPQSIKELRSFLRLTKYYQKFIRHYEMITGPLTQLVKKDNFRWNEQAKEAIQKIK